MNANLIIALATFASGTVALIAIVAKWLISRYQAHKTIIDADAKETIKLALSRRKEYERFAEDMWDRQARNEKRLDEMQARLDTVQAENATLKAQVSGLLSERTLINAQHESDRQLWSGEKLIMQGQIRTLEEQVAYLRK